MNLFSCVCCAECLEPAVVRALNDIWIELSGTFYLLATCTLCLYCPCSDDSNKVNIYLYFRLPLWHRSQRSGDSRTAQRYGGTGSLSTCRHATARRSVGSWAPGARALSVHGDRPLRDDERHVLCLRALVGLPSQIESCSTEYALFAVCNLF